MTEMLFENVSQAVMTFENLKKGASAFAGEAEMVMVKSTGKRKNGGKKQVSAVAKKPMQMVVIRMLAMVILDIVGISILTSIRREAMVELAFVNDWLLPLTVVFGILSAAALAYLIIAIVKKIDTSRHPLTPAMILCVCLFCLIACLVYKWVLPSAIVIASVVATVLFLVYCLYMHIFYR